MGTFLAALCGVLVVGGIVLFIAGFHTPPAAGGSSSTGLWTSLVDGRLGRAVRRRWWQVLLAVVAGVVVASVTGWPLLAVLVPVVGYGLPLVLSAPANRDFALLEALDRWVRTLASLLPTGRSISDAIRVSVRQAPTPIASDLRLLIARLDDRWTIEQALFALADDLDSADADAVLAALALAAQRGGTGASTTLAALADNIQDRLRALREIETERAKPRFVVRQVTVITAVVLALALAFGGSFFAPYGTDIGQVLLLALVTAYLGSLLLLRRMTLPRPRQRILAGRPAPVAVEAHPEPRRTP
ncbi:MAG: type II secretion system F family protein [Propionicimonas sp.]|uniref:type II secretion system F family protein n=1 Tax=Propionicimonas sp. TaxID=1955623 RepID=UPI003D0EF552